MAIPDFDTTLSLFRAWAKRGARMDEIAAAIALQQDGGGSSTGGGATPAQIEQAVINALADDPSVSGLSQSFDDLLIEQSNTTDAVKSVRVGNETVIVPVNAELNDGEFVTFKAFEPDFWIVGFSLVLSGECRAELRINGEKIPYLNMNVIQETFEYEIPITSDFEMYLSQVTAPVKVTGMVRLRRTI